jgi:hypothetical protein
LGPNALLYIIGLSGILLDAKLAKFRHGIKVSSSLLHPKGFLYLPNVGVLDLQLGRHDPCKDHLYHQRTPCFVFATKASKSA